jgi:plasmid stability protein
MPKMIQLRNVPDALHRKLKVRAAQEGVSLSDFVLRELRRVSERLSPRELAERIAALVERDLSPSPAELIRADRDAR